MAKASTHNGKKGGILKGDSHAAPSGGIKAVVVSDSNRPVLLEHQEVIINKKSVQDPEIKTYQGTNKQILSEINTQHGGVPIMQQGGELIKYSKSEKERAGRMEWEKYQQAILEKNQQILQMDNILGKHAININSTITDNLSNMRYSVVEIAGNGFVLQRSQAIGEPEKKEVLSFKELEDGFATGKLSIDGYDNTEQDRKILCLYLMLLSERFESGGKIKKYEDDAVAREQALKKRKRLLLTNSMDEMEMGGKIKDQYEYKTTPQVWNEWTKIQRKHFFLDHQVTDRLIQEKYTQPERDAFLTKSFAELPKWIQQEINLHVSMGQYGKGGLFGRFNKKKKQNASREYQLLIMRPDGTTDDLIFSTEQAAKEAKGRYEGLGYEAIIKQAYSKGGLLPTTAQKNKVGKVMREFKKGVLKDPAGKVIKARKQAVAIAMSEAGLSKKLGKGGIFDKKTKNEKYSVLSICDYASNKGNPDVEEDKFSTLKEAQSFYEQKLEEKNSEHGKTCLIELRKEDDDDAIKSDYQKSEKLPKGAIVVTYNHITYMNYAYKVIDIRESNNGETYEDLNVSVDHTNTDWDEVYDNISDLQQAYEKSYGIFSKLQGGSDKIESFLAEQGVKGYKEKE